MKKSGDPRHRVRQRIVQELFAYSFLNKFPKVLKKQSFQEKTDKILNDCKAIDQLIQKAAPEWPLEKIAKADLAILRLAVYELKEEVQPPKVVIDEAVELAKTFGSENSASFVNGVLGTIYSWLCHTKKKSKSNYSLSSTE